MVWLEFSFCAGLLIYFARQLCKEGVLIAEKTTLAESVIGVFFLAIATSLPEIVASSTAVFSLGRIGLGYGDIVGSVMVNLMILTALDWYEGRGRILLKLSGLSRLTGYFVIGVISMVLLSAILRTSGRGPVSLRNVGIESVLIACAYILYLRILKKKNDGAHSVIQADKALKNETFLSVWLKFIALLIVVVALSMWIARIGEKIVLATGLSQTFAGTLLLGFVTSFPEFIVSFAAVSAGSVDMAVGNILGSNLFDVCIISFLDLLSEKAILGMLTSGQILATSIALALSVISVLAFFVKKQSTLRVNWDTGLIFIIGFIGFVLLYFIQ